MTSYTEFSAEFDALVRPCAMQKRLKTLGFGIPHILHALSGEELKEINLAFIQKFSPPREGSVLKKKFAE